MSWPYHVAGVHLWPGYSEISSNFINGHGRHFPPTLDLHCHLVGLQLMSVLCGYKNTIRFLKISFTTSNILCYKYCHCCSNVQSPNVEILSMKNPHQIYVSSKHSPWICETPASLVFRKIISKIRTMTVLDLHIYRGKCLAFSNIYYVFAITID